MGSIIPLLWLIALPASGHTPTTTRFTFARDVGPILRERCGSCHAPGGIAPMPLLYYREARPWAAAIRAEVLAGRMPPWPVEDGLRFRGERLLSGREIDTLVDWSRGGAPEGPPGAAMETGAGPPPVARGEPDLVLRMPGSEVLAAGAAEGRFEMRPLGRMEDDRWLAAWELRPGNGAMVHDALVHLRPPGREPELLGSWTPGQERVDHPAGAARLLPRGAELLLSVHYARGYKERRQEMQDRSELRLWFQAEPPASRVRSMRLGTPSHLIEDGARVLAFTRTSSASTTAEAPLSVEARLPGGERRLLLSGRRFRAGWPIALRPARPLELPAGTRIESQGGFAGTEVWLEVSGPR